MYNVNGIVKVSAVRTTHRMTVMTDVVQRNMQLTGYNMLFSTVYISGGKMQYMYFS